MHRTVLLAPLLLLPACGGDAVLERTGQPAASTPSPRATTAPDGTPAATARATPTATPRALSAPAPSTAPVATGAAAAPRAPAAQGDVDGDGTADAIDVGEALAVTLSSSGKTVTSAFESDTSPAPAGSEDVDRDGRAEVFLRTGQGASTTFLTPFRYDGRTLAPLTLDGEQVVLGVGGSATHGDGFSCTDAGTLVVRSASSDDGTTFTVTSTTYRIDGHRLVQTGRTTARAQGMADPRVGQAYLVDCRSVGEGG